MVDLNLVKVFITIFDTQSVSMAAKKLNITQPSVSHSLARLRYVFKDPLFTRTKQGMLPTFYAVKLYEALNKPLLEIETVIGEAKVFDLCHSEHCFKIAMTDLGAIYFVPILMTQLEAIRTGISIEVIPLDPHKIADWLLTGRVDAAIYDQEIVNKGLSRLVLFQEHYVAMQSQQAQRSSTMRPQLNMQQYLSKQHAVISTMPNHIDIYLRARGLKRNIKLRVTQLSTVIEMVEHHHMITTLPARIAASFQSHPTLNISDLAFELPRFEVSLYWHKKQTDSLAQQWLIEFLKQSLSDLARLEENPSV